MERLTSYQRGGLRFDVRDTGPAGGPAVVCLHGFPQDGTCYREVAAALAAAGRRVLVPDQRGYSPGARPAGRAAYALPELAADVVALFDAAGVEAAAVVGHDWGGAVAWTLAGQHPSRVRALTVLGTPHPAAMARALVTSSQGFRSWYMALFQLPWLPERLLSAGPLGLPATLRRTGLPSAFTDHYLARMREPGALTAALGWYRAKSAHRPVRVGAIRVPTTYLWGTGDPFFSRQAAQGTGRQVLAHYQERALDAGHWIPETRPGAVVEAVLAPR